VPDAAHNLGAGPGPTASPSACPGEHSGRRVARGTMLLMMVQVFALGAGFLIATFLTRRLGPGDYGHYAVVANVVLWVEITVTAMFRQTTIKLVAEADDWQGAVSALARLQTAAALGVTVLLIGSASLLSRWLRAPELSGYLRLYAADVPLFAMAGVAHAALVGRGEWGRAALVTGLGWGGRLVLVLLLVGFGFSVTGAILAVIGSSLLELVASWAFVRPRLFRRTTVPRRLVWSYSLPLFLQSVGVQLFRRLDLLSVQMLAGTPAAGYYGAAQTMTIVPASLFAASFSQVLLSSLPQLLASGQGEGARAMMRQAMRLVICLLPLAGLVAGAAPEIAVFVYGQSFSSAGVAVAALVFGALGLAMLGVTGSILTASGRPGLTAALTVPLVPLSLVGYWVLVPRLGLAGAAAVMSTLAWLGAGAAMLTVLRSCGAGVPSATVLRVALPTLLAFGVASVWRAPGFWLLGKLVAICAAILLSLWLLGELTGQDLVFARSLLRREAGTSP